MFLLSGKKLDAAPAGNFAFVQPDSADAAEISNELRKDGWQLVLPILFDGACNPDVRLVVASKTRLDQSLLQKFPNATIALLLGSRGGPQTDPRVRPMTQRSELTNLSRGRLAFASLLTHCCSFDSA